MTPAARRGDRVVAGLCAAYLGAYAVRLGLAAARLRRDPPPRPRSGALPTRPAPAFVTIAQPILSGDPQLGTLLAENLAANPGVPFLWLVDADDPEGLRVCRPLADAHPQVTLVVMPPAPQGLNPKTFKLVEAQRRCRTTVLAVLDDDTVLPAGALDAAVAALGEGDLVTGIPCYRPGSTIWSRLVAAFVNGNALMTYLPMASLAPPVTINGMFVVMRLDTLERLGGFAAIERELTDDLALAQLFCRAGRTIVQTTVVHPLATTIPDLRSYVRLQRRWMVFAGRLFREQPDLRVLGLVAIPSTLPAPAALIALATRSPRAAAWLLATLGLKAASMAVLRHRVLGTPESPATIAAEVAADLLQPWHAAAGMVRPRQIQWRTRAIRLDGDGVTYA
jgi:ceramide glucosyltransferase